MSQIDNLLKEIGPVREETKQFSNGQGQNGDGIMFTRGLGKFPSSRMPPEIPGKCRLEPGEMTGPGEFGEIKPGNGQRCSCKEVTFSFMKKNLRPVNKQLFILKIVDGFDRDRSKPYQIERSCWQVNNGLMKRIKAGDRVVVLNKGEQKVYAIGTVTGFSGEKESMPGTAGGNGNEVTIKYDIINPMGVALFSINGKSLLYNACNDHHLLSRREFDDLLVRLVRAY